MFDEWWKDLELNSPSGKCDTPACSKPYQKVCENTFEHFMDREKSEIPYFPDSLTELVRIEKTLGGGKSGAYLFVVKFKRKSTDNPYVLKLYATAYGPTGHVQDTRPFREVYTQCAMSGTSGYNCLVGFARASWESVQHMFGLTTDVLYTKDLKRNKLLADGRTLNPVPTQVLFMISTFTQGTALLNLNLIDHYAIMPGVVLNLLSTMQKAERRLGRFTHWDLHADNIFVDIGCSNRSALPLAYIAEFSASYIWSKLEKVQSNKERLAAFKASVWEPLMTQIAQTTTVGRRTGKWNLDVSQWLTQAQDIERQAIQEVVQQFKVYSQRVIAYPNVTLIDFDLAHSDQFPGMEEVHHAKLKSPLPIAERTLAWLFKWIPAPYVLHLLQLLTSIRPTLSKNTQSDILHIVVYVFVALVYWDLDEREHPARLMHLTQNSDLVMGQIKQLLKQVGKLSMGSLRTFYLQSIQKIFPAACRRPPLYCGLSPILSMNFTQLSTMAVGLMQSCAQNKSSSSNPLCRFQNVFEAAQKSWLESNVDSQSVLHSIQGALLAYNIKHFEEQSQFITPDIMQLLLKHNHTNTQLHLHVELPWDELLTPLDQIPRRVLRGYSKGQFDIGMLFLDDTLLSVRVKNGADLYVDISTTLQLVVYGLNDEPGTKYDLKISKDPIADSKPVMIGSLTLYRLNLKKVGTLMELAAEMDVNLNISLPFLPAIESASIGLFRILLSLFSLPKNIAIKSNGKRIQLIMSFPPSDEPVHPCLGLATDITNVHMALNCLSSIYSVPTTVSKLLNNMTVDTQALVQVFLNQIEAIIMEEDNIVPPMPIWTMNWQPKFKFELVPYPEMDIENALKAYLSIYYGMFNKTDLPAVAQNLLDELSPLTPWQAASVDASTFNVDYVKYLSSFLKAEDFQDAL